MAVSSVVVPLLVFTISRQWAGAVGSTRVLAGPGDLKWIEDHETVFSAGFIRWNEIERLSLWALGLRLSYGPFGSSRSGRRTPSVSSSDVQFGVSFTGCPPATISPKYLNVALATLVKELKARTETRLDPALEQIASPR